MQAIVSGASRGLGKVIVGKLKHMGYSILATANKQSGLEEMAKSLNFTDTDFIFRADLSQTNEVEALLQYCIEINFQPDVIVNNAGVYVLDSIENFEIEKLLETLQINAISGFTLSKHFLPYFKNRKSGNIINICSVLGKSIRPSALSYTVSKQVQRVFSEFLVEELRPFRIKVTSIYPGSINTSSWDGIDAPLHEFVQTADIAACIEHILNLSENCWLEEITLKPIDRNY